MVLKSIDTACMILQRAECYDKEVYISRKVPLLITWLLTIENLKKDGRPHTFILCCYGIFVDCAMFAS